MTTSELKAIKVWRCHTARVRVSVLALRRVTPVTEMSQLISGHVAAVTAPLSPARCRLEVTI